MPLEQLATENLQNTSQLACISCCCPSSLSIIKFIKNDSPALIHTTIFQPRIEPTWAFIDMQNLHQGVLRKGWKIDWFRFVQYLRSSFNVTRTIAFMGFLKENQGLYRLLGRAGFSMEFRKVIRLKNGLIEGGNVDADLASFVMDHKGDYEKAVIIADDGDYARTIKSLSKQNKLKAVISSHSLRETSQLIKQVVSREQLLSIHWLRHMIAS